MDDHSKPHTAGINPWIIAVSVMFSTFMEVLDTTVVNVSLPHIAGSLSASIDESTWALTSYLVANAVILPLTGWLANHFGRKRLLMLSVAGFTIASFFCGLAPNLASLVAFRVLQGATGGALQPLSQAVLLEAFPPEGRGKAMAFWGLGIVVAPILGPVLGGWLTDRYSWRWIFYVNLPIGIISLVMTKMFIFDPPYIGKKSARIDFWGIGLLTVGIGALQVLLDKGQEDDWFASRFMVTLAVVSAFGLALFVLRELTTRDPVVNLRILKDRTFSTGVFLMTMVGFVLFGSLVLLPILMQTLLDYPPLQAGIALAPRGMGSFLAMPVIGLILARAGARKLLALGMTGGGSDVVLARQPEPEHRLLGHLLAPVHPGDRTWTAVCAAHDHHDGPDRQGGDGQRRQYLQSHAEPRRQHRDRDGDDNPGAAAAAGTQLPRHACQCVRPADARAARQPARGHDGARHGRRYRFEKGLRRRRRDAAEAGGNPFLLTRIPVHGHRLPLVATAPAADETSPQTRELRHPRSLSTGFRKYDNVCRGRG